MNGSDFLDVLFAVTTSDGQATYDEVEEIRTIANRIAAFPPAIYRGKVKGAERATRSIVFGNGFFRHAAGKYCTAILFRHKVHFHRIQTGRIRRCIGIGQESTHHAPRTAAKETCSPHTMPHPTELIEMRLAQCPGSFLAPGCGCNGIVVTRQDQGWDIANHSLVFFCSGSFRTPVRTYRKFQIRIKKHLAGAGRHLLLP